MATVEEMTSAQFFSQLRPQSLALRVIIRTLIPEIRPRLRKGHLGRHDRHTVMSLSERWPGEPMTQRVSRCPVSGTKKPLLPPSSDRPIARVGRVAYCLRS